MYTKINEWKTVDGPVNEAVKPNPMKSLNTVKTSFAALKTATVQLYNVLAEMRQSDDILVSKYADEALDSLKGNFYYTLNGDLTKYLQWLENTISNIGNKIKKRKIAIQIPTSLNITNEEINDLIYALDIEYTSKVKELNYDLRRNRIMGAYFGIDGYSSPTLLSKSRYASTFRSIGYLLKEDEVQGVKFLDLLSKKTGYNFSYRYESIIIKK